MEVGFWCEDCLERYQDMVDDFLLYDEDINVCCGMFYCFSLFGCCLVILELVFFCIDFEFCLCCNYDCIVCLDWSSR